MEFASPAPIGKPAPAHGEPDRVAALDGLRGVAILLVVVMHSLQPQLISRALTNGDQTYIYYATMGWFGVDLFFVLSGYLITGILLRSKDQPRYFRNFYARRVLRIFPLYYAFLVLMLLVLDRPAASPALAASCWLYVQNYWYSLYYRPTGMDVALAVTWSLAIEEQFYLVWPTVVYWLTRRALLIVCVACIVGALLLRLFLLQRGFDSVRVLTPCRIDALAIGACLSMLPRPSPWLARAAFVAALAGLLGIAAHAGGGGQEGNAMQGFGFLCTAVLGASMLALALGRGLANRLCQSRVLRMFGKYSYAVYLLHMLVIEQLVQRLTAANSPLPLRQWVTACESHVPVAILFAVLSATVTLWVAMASWHLFEKHFLALKRFFPASSAT